MAAKIPITTMTTRSSTMVKPELEYGIWLLAIGETARALKRFFNLLERGREIAFFIIYCFTTHNYYKSSLIKISIALGEWWGNEML